MSAYEAKKYLQYRLGAKNEHSIHSPFVFKLYTEVIKNKEKYYAYEELNKLRIQLLKNKTTLEVTDLGAGSKKLSKKRTVSDIAQVSVIPKKYGELLFRLVNYLQPKSILELGTSLGLSALYMHKAAPAAELATVEGCPNTCAFAQALTNFPPARGNDHGRSAKQNSGERGGVIHNANFETYLSTEITHKTFDLVYIDGNHTCEATLKYFHTLLDHIGPNSVMIFDDIYWSAGMTRAWEEIKKHPSVTVTIDLFKLGLVFFRKENKQKEDFCLRY